MRPVYLQFISILFFLLSISVHGHRAHEHHLKPLDDLIPPPNEFRLASGAPGPDYWQQQVDYVIDVVIDDKNASLKGRETITYHNNSPHELRFLWMQVDQNVFRLDSERNRRWKAMDFEHKTSTSKDDVTFKNIRALETKESFDGGLKNFVIEGPDGEKLDYFVAGTNVRIDLSRPLASGEIIKFVVKWENPLPDDGHSFRNGYKILDDGNKVYHVGQWYPRMCAYYDQVGWQNKSYIGLGEFALEFGNFEVSIKVPKDFVVAATGELMNSKDVLSKDMLQRLEEAKSAEKPIWIVSLDEAARKREKTSGIRRSTWRFKADNVRDFAFSCSRAYAWDAKGVEIGGKNVMAMSVYPREASALWERYSTETVAATLSGYSDHVFPYPYPVAWSTWGPIDGMEYPMISFQSSFDIENNDSYSLKGRNYVIGVIVHEVGHNWFPMIINSDEREWAFLDEGLNTFVESLVATRYDRLVAQKQEKENRIVLDKQSGDHDDPIVVAAEFQTDRGYQAYRKPTVALTVLREAVMGRELFDFCLKEFAERWAFKRPSPSDFFRTMEDASGMDLDWFWKGWFYETDPVDLHVDKVKTYRLESWNPEQKSMQRRAQDNKRIRSSWEAYVHHEIGTTEAIEHLTDWYLNNDIYAVQKSDHTQYQKQVEDLEPWEKKIIDKDLTVHVVSVQNRGGLISPFELEIHYTDNSTETLSIPASIWFKSEDKVDIPLLRPKNIKKVSLDPMHKIADVDYSNNQYPREIPVEYFELKPDKENHNPMKSALNKELWQNSKE